MNKILAIFFIFVFVSGCSLDQKTGLWSKTDKIKKEIKKKELSKPKELFTESRALKKEFNSELKIKIKSKPKKISYLNSLLNNAGQIVYNGNLKKISKYKFSKIKNFGQAELNLVFDKNNIIFFEKKGTILKFNEKSKLIWKKNFYNKSEKKLNPLLFFANNSNVLVVTDSIAKYYAVNIKNGNLIWSKFNTSPFNSQIKIYKDKFFAIDFENILRCYSIRDGREIWNLKTDQTFIKSQKILSMIIINNKIYFSNSIGDISAVDINTGRLIWQTPTQSSEVYDNAFHLKISDIVGYKNSILISNNKNQFFSLDSKSGTFNWKQNVNSNLRPTIIDDIIFTVSVEGFLVIIDNKNGNILRITDLFNEFTYKLLLNKERSRAKFQPVGFLVAKENIYLTTDNGRLFVIDILTGKIQSTLKIDREKISKPFVLNKNLFIIKDNAIIKLN